MRVLHYYAQALSHRSGVTAALDMWTAAQAERNWDVAIAAAPGPVDQNSLYHVPVIEIAHRGRARRSFVPRFADLHEAMKHFDVVVLHEGWTLSHLVAAAAAIRMGKPYVVMPHGVYDTHIVESLKGPRTLRSSLERWMLRRAAFVHVFFDSEVAAVQRLSPTAEFVVSPTGFEPDEDMSVDDSVSPFVLWFGRFDVYHKGLDILLQGLAAVPSEHRPQLVLAGYDYNGGQDRVRDMVSSLGLRGVVEMLGPLNESEKRRRLAQASVFVLPSRWECYSIALLEALAAGGRVAVSEGAHISGLLRGMSGVDLIAPDPDGWASLLTQAHAWGSERFDRPELWVRLAWSRSLADLEDAVRDVITSQSRHQSRDRTKDR